MSNLTDEQIIEAYQDLMVRKDEAVIEEDSIYIDDFIAFINSITAPATLDALSKLGPNGTFLGFYYRISKVRAILASVNRPDLDTAIDSLDKRMLGGI